MIVSKIRPGLLLPLCLLFQISTGSGATIHVPADQPTIQAGIDAASESDTVLVAPGSYTGEGNFEIDFGGKNLVVKSEAGPETTLVNMPTDGDYSEFRAFLFENGESSASVVNGFTIGGGIECTASSPTVAGNIITAGTAPQGGGLYISQGSPIIVNNLIYGNLAYAVPGPFGSTWRGEGGGAFCQNSSVRFINNTVANNAAELYGDNFWFGSPDAIVKNTISWKDAASDGIYSWGTAPTFSYSQVNENRPGEGNISTNPLFLDMDNDDYRVCAQSPCVDAGDPSLTDPDGSRSDIGVFYPVRPDCQAGSTWHVSMSGDDTNGDGSPSNPFRTIQHAIDESFYYDTIIVTNGVYSEHVVFAGLGTTIASRYLFSGDESDIQNTVIDGYSEGTTVTFDLNGNTTETITGFTIQNAVYGVECLDYSRAEIHHNIITGCTGRGIHCFLRSRVSISGNTITNNGGYGISTLSDSVTISENVIADNSGSGIACSGSDAQIIHNVIIGNADYGISCYTAHPLILRNTVSRNGTAGIYCNNSLPALEYNIIAFNIGWRGAVYCYRAPTKALRVLRCNIYGNLGGDWVRNIERHGILYGNFSADPMFCDTANGDYHVNAYSPCAPGVEPNIEPVGALVVGCGYVVCGDTDGNGELTEADLQRMLDFYYGVSDDWPFPVSAGDMDCDGVITVADIVLLAGYVHGYGPLPCCAPPPKRIDLPGREAGGGPGI